MSEWKNQERGEKERKRRDLVVDFENANFLTLPQTYWSRNCEWGPVSLVNPPGDYDPGQPLNQKNP